MGSGPMPENGMEPDLFYSQYFLQRAENIENSSVANLHFTSNIWYYKSINNNLIISNTILL